MLLNALGGLVVVVFFYGNLVSSLPITYGTFLSTRLSENWENILT